MVPFFRRSSFTGLLLAFTGLLLGCYWVVTGIVVGADRVFESGRRGFGRGEADDFDGAIVRRRGHGVGADPTGVAHRLQVQPQALHGR